VTACRKIKASLKKYFYVLRPILAIRYIQAGLGLPPVRFQSLVDAVAPQEIKESIANLIELKTVTPELGTGDAIPLLNEFIFKELEKNEGVLSGQGRPDLNDKTSIVDQLNVIYRRSIDEAFSSIE